MVSSAVALLCLAALTPPQNHPPHPTTVPRGAVEAATEPPARDAATPVAQAVLIAGFATAHDVTVRELGLGHGGLEGPPRVSSRDPGSWTSPGGALVQVGNAGVKLTFPAGGELLFTPTGFFHLRDGSQCGPFDRGFELVLADGAAVRVERSPFGRHPLGRVSIASDHRLEQLWDRGRMDREQIRWREHRGQRLMALGDGTALYAAAARGPVLFLDRLLCAKDVAQSLPERQVVVHGDPLIESLARLPQRYASPRGDFPQVDVLARSLASATRHMLPAGRHALAVVGTNPLRLGLGGTYELTIEGRGTAPLRLGLRADPTSEMPLVEWVLGRRQKLEVLRPGATDEPGRRYFERGMEVMRPDRWPLPARNDDQDALWSLQVLAAVSPVATRR